MNIKEWYTKTYPSDPCGEDLNPEATFDGLFETLDNYEDVYAYIGEYDSLVRERCFQKLSEIMNCEYNYLHNQWLLCK